MSSTELSADTLQPSSMKPDIDSVYNLGIKPSEEARQAQLASLQAATSLKCDSNQQESHILVNSDKGHQSPYRAEHNAAERKVFGLSTELRHKMDLVSVPPKSAVSGAEDYSNRRAEDDDISKGLSYGGFNDDVYLDPTSETPRQEISPSSNSAVAAASQDDGSSSEIQSIMDQFDQANDDNRSDETGQPIIGATKSHFGTPTEYPARQSSLEPLRPMDQPSDSGPALDLDGREGPALKDRSRAPPMRTSSLPQSVWSQDTNAPSSPSSSKSLPKLPPPGPDPEPDLPFDFHRFLEQLRHRTADPVAKFLRSFLIEFGKKQWMVHEQVKIINDFLSFITNKMAQCEVWRGVSDAEFDNAKEGMEKLVMNRLYAQTFSPAIPAPAPVQIAKGKRKAAERTLGPGRKGQHQEDIERDEILAQKVRIYGWVQEKHLEIPPVGDSGRRFLILAQQGEILLSVLQLWFTFDISTELLKIKTYRAPRDKVICVLNCCKVIFGEKPVGLVLGKPHLTTFRLVAKFESLGYFSRLFCTSLDLCRSPR